MTRLDGRFIKPGSIPADRLDPAIPLQRFVTVTWGEVAAAGPNTKTVPLRLRDYLGSPISTARVLRVTCDDRARLSVGEHGSVLSGPDSPDLIAQTDDTGRLDLIVSCPVQAVVTLAAGPTQGSPLLDASATVDISFT